MTVPRGSSKDGLQTPQTTPKPSEPVAMRPPAPTTEAAKRSGEKSPGSKASDKAYTKSKNEAKTAVAVFVCVRCVCVCVCVCVCGCARVRHGNADEQK